MKRLLLIGAGEGGSALLDVLMETKQFHIVGVVDRNENSKGLKKARQRQIPTFLDWRKAYDALAPIDVVVEVTGDVNLYDEIRNDLQNEDTLIIPSSVAAIMFYLIDEKETLINEVKKHSTKLDIILDSTHDGMIAIDLDGNVALVNKSAEKIVGFNRNHVIGKYIDDVLPSSNLQKVLKTGKAEANKKVILPNGRTVVTTRVPMYKGKELIGAFGVFKDITDIVRMAEEVTNLKSVQKMLEAIILSSNDAISVVDEHGKGLLINPAYTRLTGLTEKEVIGKPATIDISEGESMHMQVLKTGIPVRGVKMKVGPKHKDVIVNVAPVIVDGKVKGSVGVIHDMSEIKMLTSELERAKQIIRTLEAKYTFADIIGSSAGLQHAIQEAKKAAVTPAAILLYGESGTGKELFAHAIHNASKRKYNKFVRVNCAAISESLLESELFGYEEGAFSGAKRGGKRGLFEEANGGSIFLDEIGEISRQMQSKLLRVLQEKEIVRVGGTKAIPVDVRIISATNANMDEKLAKKEFRSDLYYRLNRIPIYIPPLRERIDDLDELCNHLLIKLNQDFGRNVEGITEKAMELLRNYHWPGNVRELENILGRAMINMHYMEKYIDVIHLPPLHLRNEEKGIHIEEIIGRNDDRKGDRSLQSILDEVEKQILVNALKENNGNKTKTAEALKISIRNLYYKLEKYKLTKY